MNRLSLKAHLLYACLLVAICAATYWTSLGGDFVLDDQYQIVGNIAIRDLRNIPAAFVLPAWSFLRGPCADPAHAREDVCRSTSLNYYRPVQTALFTIAYAIGALDPFYYHLLNVILHCIATLFIYFLCLELPLAAGSAIVAAMLFAVHPVHTEAIAWIACTGELACGAFYFAALWTFVKFVKTQSTRWMFLSAGFFLVALLSKEMAVTLPLVALGLTLIYRKWQVTSKELVLSLFSYAVAFGVYVYLRVLAVGFTIAPAHFMAGFVDWITLGISVLGRYLWFVVIPFPLSAYHSIPIPLAERWTEVLIAAAAIGILASCFNRSWRRGSNAALWFCIFLITLIPVFNFKAIVNGVYFSERYLYIPSFAAIIAGVLLLPSVPKKYATVLTCIVVGAFGVLAAMRNLTWRDNETLFRTILERNPQATQFWTALGIVEIDKGNLDYATLCYENALRQVTYLQNPGIDNGELYRIHLGLGTIAARRQNYPSAKSHFESAMREYPRGSLSYTYLGGLLLDSGGNPSEAISLLQHAIDLNSGDEIARDFMGVALFNQGRTQDAVRSFQEALRINPRFKEAQNHLNLVIGK